ncbi:hypothetical protein V2A84_01805 [Yersinia sp. 2553 StPb PI]|uniref:hypothetical protein n=1 Tax=Yersinia sp. 2553 StPb PI TaxID=3117411 RepID=UPI003FA458A1
MTPEIISKLCNSWLAASIIPDGGFRWGKETEKYRLSNNGVVFHELDFNTLCSAIIGTTNVLLLPGLNTIIDQDHYRLWSWCGALLLSRRGLKFTYEQMEAKKLLETSVRCALVKCSPPLKDQNEWRKNVEIMRVQPMRVTHLVNNSDLILAYISFPLLEFVLKRACSIYVNMDGVIIKRFNRYTDDDVGKSKISSLKILLKLLYNHVADKELRSLLTEFQENIKKTCNSPDAFALIYDWRNQSLHGKTNFSTIGGTLLSLSLLILLFEIKDDFENVKLEAMITARGQVNPHTSYYPPEGFPL